MKIIILLLLFSVSTFAQKVTINGYVQDAKTGEKLIGATVYNEQTKKGAITNNYGFFSIE